MTEKAEINDWVKELIDEFKKDNPNVDLFGEEDVSLKLTNKVTGNEILLSKINGEWRMQLGDDK